MDDTQNKFNLFMLGITIVLMFLMASCDRPKPQYSADVYISTNEVFNTDTELFSSSDATYYKTIIEIDGIKHEYITVYGYRSRNGITHYPECKYCKQKEGKTK